MSGGKFLKTMRLRITEQFEAVFKNRNTASDEHLTVFVLQNGLAHCRLGLSISRKRGNAVVRNTWKRKIRDAFRRTQTRAAVPLDIVVVPQKGMKVDVSQPLGDSFAKLFAKLCQRFLPTVLITRQPEFAEPLKSDLEAIHYRVLLEPAVDILPPDCWDSVDQCIEQVQQGQFDYLVFSSANGVNYFAERFNHLLLNKSQPDKTQFSEAKLDNVRIAVVGKGTDAVLQQRFRRGADVIPEQFNAEAVAEKLRSEAAGKRFLLVRGLLGRDVLKTKLMSVGASVSEAIVYRSVDRAAVSRKILDMMQTGRIDYVTATSPNIAASLVRLFGEALWHTKIVSISALTSETLRQHGFEPHCVAPEASMQGMLECFQQFIDGKMLLRNCAKTS
ncbi:hypothetical protein FACS189454_01180 [Planctomycetales bacterium]|nr:hypothetical protein FACS189454_01180 [Planctomycetales bacterium]